MKTFLVLVTTVAVAASLAAPALARTRSIKVGDDYFVRRGSPPVVVVKRGTFVRWVWRGRTVHNVVGRGPQRFRSKTQVKGTYRRKFRKRGTYRIVCTIHSGMEMKLRVR